MIHSIVGLMSSGKTLYMSYLAFKDFIGGSHIISNYDLSFPHYKCNQDFIYYLSQNNIPIDNLTFCLDEFWLWLQDSRKSMSKANRASSYFFLQSSKAKKIHIYLSAQRVGQYDLRTRENQHYLTICERKLLIENKIKNLHGDINSERILPKDLQDKLYIKAITYSQKANSMMSTYKKDKTEYIKASYWFNLYNTNQRIMASAENLKGK